MTRSEIIAEISSRLEHLYDKSEARAIAIYYVTDRLGYTDKSTFTVDVLPPYFTDDMRRLESGEPLQYVTGIQYFMGLPFRVSPAVLIPRPETEELTEWIVNETSGSVRKNILDVGTGSGCIPVILKLKNPALNVYATDISEAALELARLNAHQHGAEVHFVNDSILDPGYSISGGWDIIVSNPPYIPLSQKHELAVNVASFEPHLALFAPNDDPVLYYKAVCNYAIKHLRKDGVIYFEVHPETSLDVVNYLKITGFSNFILRKDLSGKVRFIRASRDFSK